MMTTTRTRKIIRIDEEKCNGCGDCVPSCAEGALKIIDGKARLVADKFCDGLGACLGHCPTGALTVEERPAEEFDEQAVHAHLHGLRQTAAPRPPQSVPLHAHAQPASHGGCPGSRLQVLSPQPVGPSHSAGPTNGGANHSRLGQWPVQLTLVPPTGPLWDGRDVLIAADCVPFALNGFHDSLLAGKTLAIACPKLDDVRPYIQKLAMIFGSNSIRSITVAIMEVPCCAGLLRVVQMALDQSGRTDISINHVKVSVRGEIAAK